MKQIQHILSVFLVLCVGAAGLAGFSPLLHVLLDHGGHGPVHVHRRVVPTAAPTQAGARQEFQREPKTTRRALHREAFVSQHRSFSLPLRAIRQWGHALGRLLASDHEADDKGSGDTNGDSHHHQSLSQLLAGGLVELALDHAVHIRFSANFVPLDIPNPEIFRIRDFDPQTASRPPPFAA